MTSADRTARRLHLDRGDALRLALLALLVLVALSAAMQQPAPDSLLVLLGTVAIAFEMLFRRSRPITGRQWLGRAVIVLAALVVIGVIRS